MPQWAVTRPVPAPTCIKRTKRPPLFSFQSLLIGNTLTPLHLLLHPSVHCGRASLLEQCMQLWRRTTVGNFECYCTRYEEAACIKAAMTPFWSGRALNLRHPPQSPLVCPARCKPVTHCLACINPGTGARKNLLSLL